MQRKLTLFFEFTGADALRVQVVFRGGLCSEYLNINSASIQRIGDSLREAFRVFILSKRQDADELAFATVAWKKCCTLFSSSRSLFEMLSAAIVSDSITETEICGSLASTFPFDLLYWANPESSKYERFNFWGVRHPVIRQVPTDKWHYSSLAPHVQSGEQFSVVSVVGQDYRDTEELNAIRQLEARKTIKITDLSACSDTNEFLERFLNEQCDLAHFACHCSAVKQANGEERVLHLDFGGIRAENFAVLAPLDVRKPFVFLNSCKSAPYDHTDPADFLNALYHKHAIGLLVTEADIPNDFAVDFARVFYANLAREMRVGPAFYAARTSFISGKYRISGLAYALFCDPNLILI